MPVYASFDYDFLKRPFYLTPGKRYAVTSHSDKYGFIIEADDGAEINCLWRGCPHLDGRNWTRHEEPDAEPTPELPDDPREIAATDEFLLRRASNGGWVVDGGTDDTPILAAFTNTADLLAGLPALLGGAK